MAGRCSKFPCGSWPRPWARCSKTQVQFFNLDTTSEVLFGLESRGASHQEMEQAPFLCRKGLRRGTAPGSEYLCPVRRGEAAHRLCQRLRHGTGDFCVGRAILQSGRRRYPPAVGDPEADESGGKDNLVRNTASGMPPTWQTGCSICGKGGWNGYIPEQNFCCCLKSGAEPWA